MKRIYFFDVDNTIRSNKEQKIYPQTLKLLEHLSKNPDYILGFATGRGPAKIDVIDEIKSFFKYKVLVNGAIILENDRIFYELPIKTEDVDMVIKDTMSKGISMGMVGYDQEAITFFDDHVSYAFKGYTTVKPIEDPEFHKKHHVYQLWIFNSDSNLLMNLAKTYKQFTPYLWHYGGIDLVYPYVSKDQAIKEIMKQYPDYELITVGDGHNDIEMIKLGDIGIAMGNSGFDDVKAAATLVAPRIEEDKLFDFFKEHDLL
ncbi:MAG TPA: HAD family hydrolase [Acholeplasma sp.]|jgi:peptidyl-prolyl cis-trans isomerase B (cyclophilin B)